MKKFENYIKSVYIIIYRQSYINLGGMEMNLKKLSAMLLTLALSVSVFAGCGKPGTGTEKPAEEKILKMGLSGYTGLFNPIMSDNTYDTYVVDLIFEALVKLNKDGEYEPNIAEWKISEDKLTYTFTLKDGIKFSDGTDLTADDVAFTYMTIANPKYDGPRAYAVSSLEGYEAYQKGEKKEFPGIKVVDKKTIEFKFAEGKAAPSNIESFVYGIMSKDYYKFDTWEAFLELNEKPLGSNVMVFDSWAPKEFIKLKKNTKYWDSANAAKIDGVLMSEVPDDSIIASLQSGDIDFAQPGANKDNVAAIEGLDNVTLQSYLGNGYTFMAFNTKKETLSDVKVRQALLYALDRESFIKAEYGSEEIARVGLAPLSPTSWAFPDEKDLNPYKFDLEKAKGLLEEAGWKVGSDGFRYKGNTKLSLSWLVYTESTWPTTLSGMAADTWKQIGVDLKIELMDFDTVAERTMDAKPEDKNFDVYTMGFSLSVDPDPTGALFDADAYMEGGFNATGFRDAKSQELVQKGKAEYDQTKRAEIYKEWAKLQNELVPTVIIAYRNEIWGVNNRVKGMELGSFKDWVTCIKDITIE